MGAGIPGQGWLALSAEAEATKEMSWGQVSSSEHKQRKGNNSCVQETDHLEMTTGFD